MDRVFCWLWRINGLLFLLCALLILGNLGHEFFERLTREKAVPKPSVTKMVADPQGKEQWQLSSLIEIEGSDYAYVRLESKNANVKPADSNLNMFGPPGDYAPKKAKNILFINRKDETAKWLFNGVSQIVLSVTELPKRSYAGNFFERKEPTNTIAIVYSVVAKDTNGDGIVNSLDNAALAVSGVDGVNYNIVLENSERIVSTELIDEDTLSIIYQKEGRAYSKKYSLKSFESLSEFELPEVGH